MSLIAHCLTCVEEAELIAQIHSADRRVLLLAPGISEPLANALGAAWRRLGPRNVEAILDVEPESCRLGYGTIAGLRTLHNVAAEQHTFVQHEPGVRIGLLICDDTTIIFSPTPLLIEDKTDGPNGFRLHTPVISNLARDPSLDGNDEAGRMLGLAPVQASQIDAVSEELARVPPVSFELARRVCVYTSQFQFVELEMKGCFVSRKRVPIPSSLVGLANNRDAAEQFHARFNLVNSAKLFQVRVESGGKERIVTEESLAKRKQQILKDYVTPLKGYGSVVLRSNKDRLLQAVEALKMDLAAFQKGVKDDLQRHMDDNARSLVEALLPAVRANPPAAYTKVHGPRITRAQIRDYLERDIRHEFGRADDLVSDMKISVVFKDVAYESLVDEQFLKAAHEALPGIESSHDEHEAAEGVSKVPIAQVEAEYLDPKRFPLTTQNGLNFRHQKMIDAHNQDELEALVAKSAPMTDQQKARLAEFREKQTLRDKPG